MSRAEEQALKAYPKRGWKCKDAEGNDAFLDSNRGCRLAYVQGYEQGYKQAREDLMKDAIETTIDGDKVKVIIVED